MAVNKKGFTFIEILVTTGILATLGLITVNIFFTTLKGGLKAEFLKEIKQNGSFALSTMERMIRNAEEVTSTCDGSSLSSITILNPDLAETTFECLWDSTNKAAYLASRSAALTRALTGKNVTLGETSCPSAIFICTQADQHPETVDISFTLYQKGSSTRPEEQASATFETTVSLRNY